MAWTLSRRYLLKFDFNFNKPFKTQFDGLNWLVTLIDSNPNLSKPLLNLHHGYIFPPFLRTRLEFKLALLSILFYSLSQSTVTIFNLLRASNRSFSLLGIEFNVFSSVFTKFSITFSRSSVHLPASIRLYNAVAILIAWAGLYELKKAPLLENVKYYT